MIGGCSLFALQTASYARQPSCTDSRVTKTVLQLAKEHLPLPKRFGYAMDAVRTTEQKADSASCTADLMRVYEDSAVYAVNHVSYSVLAKLDGELEVTVHGLP